MPKIITNEPKVERLITGMWSFDRSFQNYDGDIGYPLGKSAEIHGVTHCGKSTFTYALAGLIAAAKGGNIALADFEGYDPIFLNAILENSGMHDGIVYDIRAKEDEDILDELLNKMYDNCNIGILDSVGAISPISELEGDLGEANMGRRAKLMAQFCRKAMHLFKQKADRNLIMINHTLSNLGTPGYVTPGGDVKNYLNSIRVQMKQKEIFPDGSYIIEGKVKKNRWGYKDRIFHVFMLAGVGLSKDMTAVFDGVLLKLVTRSTTVKIGNKSYGRLKTLVEKARDNEHEFFQPFYEVLQTNGNIEGIEQGEDGAGE